MSVPDQTATEFVAAVLADMEADAKRLEKGAREIRAVLRLIRRRKTASVTLDDMIPWMVATGRRLVVEQRHGGSAPPHEETT